MKTLRLIYGLTLLLAACGGKDDTTDTTGDGPAGGMDMAVLSNVAAASAFANAPTQLLGMDARVVSGALSKKPPPCPATTVVKSGSTTTVTATGDGCKVVGAGGGIFSGTMVMTSVDGGKGSGTATYVHTGWGVSNGDRANLYDGTFSVNRSPGIETITTTDLRYQDSAPSPDFGIDAADVQYVTLTNTTDRSTKNQTHITTTGSLVEATLGAVDADADVTDVRDGCNYEPESGTASFTGKGTAVVTYTGDPCDGCVDVVLADGTNDQICVAIPKKGE
jgi:hypothetical protein